MLTKAVRDSQFIFQFYARISKKILFGDVTRQHGTYFIKIVILNELTYKTEGSIQGYSLIEIRGVNIIFFLHSSFVLFSFLNKI